VSYNLKISFLEHQRYIRTNNPKSAYAPNILNNKHEYSPLQTTLWVIKTCKEVWHMNCVKNIYFRKYQLQGSLINEQILAKFALVHDSGVKHASVHLLHSTWAASQHTHSVDYVAWCEIRHTLQPVCAALYTLWYDASFHIQLLIFNNIQLLNFSNFTGWYTLDHILRPVLVYTTQRITQTTANLYQKRLAPVWCCCHNNMDLRLPTHVF
jgi:hypothetical protein